MKICFFNGKNDETFSINHIELLNGVDHFFKIECPVIVDSSGYNQILLPILFNLHSNHQIEDLLFLGSFSHKMPGEPHSENPLDEKPENQLASQEKRGYEQKFKN